jgi:hypothetical protein
MPKTNARERERERESVHVWWKPLQFATAF